MTFFQSLGYVGVGLWSAATLFVFVVAGGAFETAIRNRVFLEGFIIGFALVVIGCISMAGIITVLSNLGQGDI